MFKIFIAFAIGSLLFSYPTEAKKKVPTNTSDEFFDVDLQGYRIHVFGSFNQIGYEITALDQLYLGIIEREGEWIGEPRLYIKGDQGYFHLYKQDGTNVLYKVKKRSSGHLEGMWEIVTVKRRKINRIPVPKPLLKQALIERLINPISEAIHEYYGRSKLWYRGMEKVLEIKKDEKNRIIEVTVQVQTFEGPHNPPYGEETITFRIKGSEIDTINYLHRDISNDELTKLKLR